MVAIGRNIATMLTGRSGGDNLQATLQALGMGQRAAAMQAALHDLSQGNLAGYKKNMFEAATGFDPGAMRGGAMARPFGCAHTGVARGAGRVKFSRTYAAAFGGAQTIDATGHFVFPAGVEIHTHLDGILHGMRTVDDWYVSSVGAALAALPP